MTAVIKPARKIAMLFAALAVALVSISFRATPEADGAYPGGND